MILKREESSGEVMAAEPHPSLAEDSEKTKKGENLLQMQMQIQLQIQIKYSENTKKGEIKFHFSFFHEIFFWTRKQI